MTKASVLNYLDFFPLYRYADNRERSLVRSTVDRARMMASKLRKQDNKCFYCAEPIDMTGNLDHVIPVYYGGTNRSVNLVASCVDCNILKGTQQMIITNPDTIAFYEELKRAHRLWMIERKRAGWAKVSKTRQVRLYYIYRADLFRGRHP